MWLHRFRQSFKAILLYSKNAYDHVSFCPRLPQDTPKHTPSASLFLSSLVNQQAEQPSRPASERTPDRDVSSEQQTKEPQRFKHHDPLSWERSYRVSHRQESSAPRGNSP